MADVGASKSRRVDEDSAASGKRPVSRDELEETIANFKQQLLEQNSSIMGAVNQSTDNTIRVMVEQMQKSSAANSERLDQQSSRITHLEERMDAFDGKSKVTDEKMETFAQRVNAAEIIDVQEARNEVRNLDWSRLPSPHVLKINTDRKVDRSSLLLRLTGFFAEVAVDEKQ